VAGLEESRANGMSIATYTGNTQQLLAGMSGAVSLEPALRSLQGRISAIFKYCHCHHHCVID